jgi:hypothetical integral membrane protein (TIGR02206 family)
MRSPFQLFSTLHLSVIACCLLALLLLVFYLKKGTSPIYRRRDIMIFTVVFLLIEAALVGSKIAAGEWSLQYNLPLHLCDISAITILVALYTRSKTAFELGWYWGFVGGLMAILMPNLQFIDGYFIPFFVWHLFLIAGPIYQLLTDRLTLTYKSIYRALGTTVLLGCGMFVVNRWLGSNYMFVNEKITSFDAIGLPDFPSYLPYLVLIAGVMYHLVWGVGVWFSRSRA